MRLSGHRESVGEAAYREAAYRMDEIEGSEAFRRLYEAYYPDVLAYCVRRVGRDDARDLAAEVFAVAWRRLEVVPKGDGLLPAADSLCQHFGHRSKHCYLEGARRNDN